MKKVCVAIPLHLFKSYLATLIVVSGNWKGAAPVPESNLEALEERLKGDEKDDFLRFLRRMLCWLPEERASAKELLFDPWLMRGLFK
ncbi:hypothetical protein PITC_071690 [Penicillium italicum]|uniref:Protein kinase domain-containing protein n=1 Tax=Penicillium italicum TaxID=40296 RepID=A0A0A2LET8_PENIT|nr:hypothetical protein PITC_071690 [Penicillium italicum]